MTYGAFNWQVAESDPVTGRPVWGVRCDVCRELVRVPNTDGMSREAHETKRIEIAINHQCKGASKAD